MASCALLKRISTCSGSYITSPNGMTFGVGSGFSFISNMTRNLTMPTIFRMGQDDLHGATSTCPSLTGYTNLLLTSAVRDYPAHGLNKGALASRLIPNDGDFRHFSQNCFRATFSESINGLVKKTSIVCIGSITEPRRRFHSSHKTQNRREGM